MSEKKGLFDLFSDTAKSVSNAVSNIVDSVEDKYDLGTDGKLDMNDLISMLLKSEGSVVDRNAFLQELLQNDYSQEVIDKAIETNLIEAGLSLEQIKALAMDVITKSKEGTKPKNTMQEAGSTLKESEKEEVSEEEIEKALSGSVEKAKDLLKKAGNVSAILSEDKFLKETLKALQKIQYLYGMPEIRINKNGTLEDAKSRLLILLGYAAMNQIENAKDAFRAILNNPDVLYKEDLTKKVLTSDAIDTIIKAWRKKFLAEKLMMSAAGSNPVVGKAAQRAAYEKTFEPHCLALIEMLEDTAITNPNHKPSEKELEILDAISKY